MAARSPLWRPRQPLPLFRVKQLPRAATVSALLAAHTVAVGWVAVAPHADRYGAAQCGALVTR